MSQQVKNRKTPCNGVRHPIFPYTEADVALFDRVVPLVRNQFVKDTLNPSLFEGEVRVGQRVCSDVDVFMRLRSQFPAAEFQTDPFERIYDAMQGCAEADFFYATEKRYDDAPYEKAP